MNRIFNLYSLWEQIEKMDVGGMVDCTRLFLGWIECTRKMVNAYPKLKDIFY